MGEKLKQIFEWGKKEVASPFVAYIQQSFAGMLSGMRGRKGLEEYRNWVFACVQARAEEVGNIWLKLYKEDEEQEDHKILDVLYRVNPYMTKQDLFFGTQAFLDLTGDAFWFLARDKNGEGEIREIYLMRPDRITIVPSKTNGLQVEGYVYNRSDGGKIPFSAKEVLHFRNFNPLAEHPLPHRGMGIVEAAIWAIDTDNQARQWNYSFFKNSARPDGFLVKDGNAAVSDAEFKRLKAQFSQEHQGSGNAHKVGILSGGLKWQEVTRSQKDMDFIEQRRFSRDEIFALFRTPKSVLGIIEDVNRANAEASNYVFALRTVKPLMEKIVCTLNEFFVPEFGEDGITLDFVSPVPEDRLATITEYEKGTDRWLTRNEVRKREGLPPTKNGDQIFGSFTSVAIDFSTEESEGKAYKKPKLAHKRFYPRKKKEAPKKEKDIVADAVDKFVAQLPKEKEAPEKKRQLSELAINNHVAIWKQFIDISTNPLKNKLNAYLDEQRDEVLKNITEELKGLEAKEFKFKALADLLFNKERAIGAAISLMTPEIRKYIRVSGEQAILLTGADIIFNEGSEAVLKFVEDRAEMFAKTFNETTANALLEELKRGVEEEEDAQQLSVRISSFYDNEKNYRSDRAARTEVSASANFGSVEAYTQAGVEEHKWIVVNPQDEDCQANAGEAVKIGSAFPSGVEYPPQHPNCECTTIPIF